MGLQQRSDDAGADSLFGGARVTDPETSHDASNTKERSGRAGLVRGAVLQALRTRSAHGGTIIEVASDIGMGDQVQNMSNSFVALERSGLIYRTTVKRRNPKTKAEGQVWYSLMDGQEAPVGAIKAHLSWKQLAQKAMGLLEKHGIEFDPTDPNV